MLNAKNNVSVNDLGHALNLVEGLRVAYNRDELKVDAALVRMIEVLQILTLAVDALVEKSEDTSS